MEEVRKGNLHPDHYIEMLDFMAEYGRQKYGRYERYGERFNEHLTDDTITVNKRRDLIGMRSLQQNKKASLVLDSVLKYNIRNRILSDF
jgi:hypothetical protein